VVGEALAHQLAGLVDWDPDARLVVDGLSRSSVPGDEAARAQLAARGRGRAAAALADYHEVLRELGPDVGAAVAGAGFVALRELGGEEAVGRVAAVVLRERRDTSWPSGWALRRATPPGWASRAAGVDEGAWLARWEEVLARPGPGDPAGSDLAFPELTVLSRDGEWVAEWGSGPSAEGLALEWVVLDALQTAPLPRDKGELHPLPRGEGPGEGELIGSPGSDPGEFGIPADPRAPVAARWVLPAPELGARVTSPWVMGR
jgi:hypothetical protein